MDIIVTAVVGLFVAYMAFGKGRLRKNWDIIKTYRVRHFISNVLVVGVVSAVGVALMIYVPFFDKNPILWVISKFFGDGDGSGVKNPLLAGSQWEWYALIYLPVLMFALPSLAKSEEKAYREGTRDWAHGVVRSIGFGLAHLIVLIPIGMALALSIGGIWFTHQYFKVGVERSTTYHAVYNSILFAVAFGLIFFL